MLYFIFDFRFDFCKANDTILYNESPVENLGQVVFGERIRPSPYEVRHVFFCIFFIRIYLKPIDKK